MLDCYNYINDTDFHIKRAALVKLNKYETYLLYITRSKSELGEHAYATLLDRKGDRLYEFKRAGKKYQVEEAEAEDGSIWRIKLCEREDL